MQNTFRMCEHARVRVTVMQAVVCLCSLSSSPHSFVLSLLLVPLPTALFSSQCLRPPLSSACLFTFRSFSVPCPCLHLFFCLIYWSLSLFLSLSLSLSLFFLSCISSLPLDHPLVLPLTRLPPKRHLIFDLNLDSSGAPRPTGGRRVG